MDDFLYATTDVAIWSCSETGIGIAASSFATLRPLFRTFLSRSKLLGGSSTEGVSNGWPKISLPNSKGYLRSGSNGRTEEFALRNDLGKNAGVTTIINSDADVERQSAESKSTAEGSKLGKHEPSSRGWNTSESKLTEPSSDDEIMPWGIQVRKTTVSTQIIN